MTPDAIQIIDNYKDSVPAHIARAAVLLAYQAGIESAAGLKNEEASVDQELRIIAIKNAISLVFGVTEKELLSNSRKGHIPDAKSVAVYHISAIIPNSRVLGLTINKDHATILHHRKRYRDLYDTSREFRRKATAVENILKAQQ